MKDTQVFKMLGLEQRTGARLSLEMCTDWTSTVTKYKYRPHQADECVCTVGACHWGMDNCDTDKRTHRHTDPCNHCHLDVGV